MGKLFYGFGLASVLVFALAAQVSVPNFAGAWTLDIANSQDLAPRYKHFERVSWEITQTNEEISLKESFVDFNVKHRPPAGPGTGGGGKPIGPRTYNFNGQEIITDLGRSKFARKAILSSDGKTLELIEKTTSQGTDREVTSITSDKLSLSPDGKVLTVMRQTDGSRGRQNSILVFTK
jgi:hypothetical protein